MHNTGSYPTLDLTIADLNERDQLEQLLAADRTDMVLLQLVACIAAATIFIALAASLV
jgi:hypothetical protein